MDLINFEKYSEYDARRMFEQLDEMQIHSPGLTLFDQLEFCEYLDEALKKINESDKPREIILEAWLIIDYIITYMLRDGLNIPEEIENEFHLLPFQFERKLDFIQRLRDSQSDKLPNQKEYYAFDIHKEFFEELQKDQEFFKKFLDLAMRFEQRKIPEGALAIKRNDYHK